jgi:hypothetical protein
LGNKDLNQYANIMAGNRYGFDAYSSEGNILLSFVLIGLGLVEDRLKLFTDGSELFVRRKRALTNS